MGVLERRLARDALALGDVGDELVEQDALRLAPRALLAALERRTELLGQGGGEIVDLAAGDPLGQRLEHGLHRALRARAIEARPALDAVQDRVEGQRLRRGRVAATPAELLEQRRIVAGQLVEQGGGRVAGYQSCEGDEDGSGVLLRSGGIDALALRDPA